MKANEITIHKADGATLACPGPDEHSGCGLVAEGEVTPCAGCAVTIDGARWDVVPGTRSCFLAELREELFAEALYREATRELAGVS